MTRAAGAAYKTAATGARYAGQAGKYAKKVGKIAAHYSMPPWLGATIQFAGDVARGKNVARAFRAAAKAGIKDLRERMRYAQMVAPFVPGVGTGVAALGAANAAGNRRDGIRGALKP